MTKLKPCPFCGEEPIKKHYFDNFLETNMYYVTCRNKKCFQPYTDGWRNKASATRQWNTRKG